MRQWWKGAAAICVASLSMYACDSDSSEDEGAGDPVTAGTGGRTSSSLGGSGSSIFTGLGGFGVGGFGTGGFGGGDPSAGGSPTLPELKNYEPPFSVGSPGWRVEIPDAGASDAGHERDASVEAPRTFCSERYGATNALRVWSDSSAVFLGVSTVPCPLTLATPCGNQGTTYYKNDGKGWRVFGPDTNFDTPSGMTGVPGQDRLMQYGDTCGVTFIESDGTSSCSYRATSGDPDGGTDGVERVRVLPSGVTLLTSLGRVVDLVGEQWKGRLRGQPGAGANGLPVWADFAPFGDDLLLVGPLQNVTRLDPAGKLTPVTGVPIGDYGSVWAYSETDAYLLNGLGQILHFDGLKWKLVVPESETDPIGEIWGAPDHTLYFLASRTFGRVTSDGIETLARLQPRIGQQPAFFMGLWGNDANEVFVGFDDPSVVDYRCHGVFALYFDGKALHFF